MTSMSSLVWVTVTVLAYQAAHALFRRCGGHPVANPVLVSVIVIACVLRLTATPYETYFDGARLVHFLLGPATVALAIPLHAQVARLKPMLVPLAVAVLVGSVTAIGSAALIAHGLGASRETVLSLAPKSATMPIALGISEKIGGVPALTALAVTLTGVSGAIMARALLKFVRVGDPAVGGFAVGVTAHAIGTAQALQVSETAGAFAALAPGLNGVVTTMLVPVLVPLVAGSAR